MANEVIPPQSKMWDYLTGFEKYARPVPFYVKNPFNEKQIQDLRKIVDDAKETREWGTLKNPVAGDKEEKYSLDRFDPRVIDHMSRAIVEFECPQEAEDIMNSHVLPVYKDDIKLAHYSYLDYNPKYGGGEYLPSLPPHVDGANTLVTFNYCLDANIDWEIYVDNERYELNKGDALVFSAINQVHWRPKRKWKDGEFCEILTFDYSPLDDWRFTGESNPLDYRFYPEFVDNYDKDLHTKKQYIDAWNLYNKLGLEIGISEDEHGAWANGSE